MVSPSQQKKQDIHLHSPLGMFQRILSQFETNFHRTFHKQLNSDLNHSFHFVHLHSDFLHEWSWHSRDVLSTRMDFSPTKYYRAVRPPLALQRCIIHTNGFYTSKIQGRAANGVGNTPEIYYPNLRILHVQNIWPYGHIWHVQMKNNKTHSE